MKQEKIRTLVKELLKLQDKNILEASRSADISYTSMRNYIKGRTELKYQTTVNVFNVLGIDLEQIMIDTLLKSIQEHVQSRMVAKSQTPTLSTGVAPWPLSR